MKPSIQQRLKSIALALITLTATVFAQAETKLYYIHNDHLGTPVAMTDENQVVVWEANRKPFGETTETTNTVDQQARFPGQYLDEETGLSYNYYRDYDPSVGRYIQSDPIGLWAGPNTYAYVDGNPMTLYDPYGLFDTRARAIRHINKNTGETYTTYRFQQKFYDNSFETLVRDYGRALGRLNWIKKLGEYAAGQQTGVSDLSKEQKAICDAHESQALDIYKKMGFREGGGNSISEENFRKFLNRVRTEIPEVRKLYPDSMILRAKERSR